MVNKSNIEKIDKLYRKTKEILLPTISKKNISNYKIIIEENLLPLRIYYPKRVTNMKNIMIFVSGNSKIDYSELAEFIALETNNLIIKIDYSEYTNLNKKDLNKKIQEVIIKLKNDLDEIDIKNITILADSTGSTKILNIKDKLNIDKYILLNPNLSSKYITKKVKEQKDLFNNTLVIVGDKDTYYEEVKVLCNNINVLKDYNDNILRLNDETLKRTIIKYILDYLKKSNG